MRNALTLAFALASLAFPALAAVKMNEAAPDFALSDANGKTVKLSDYKGKQVVVVYFYPKDDTMVCAEEACIFRDKYEDLKKAGAEVIGISSDSVASHKKFVEHRKLPFVLLSDPKGKVRKEWGVPHAMGGMMPGRVTYVIDKGGVVRMEFSSLMDADKHVKLALEKVTELQK